MHKLFFYISIVNNMINLTNNFSKHIIGTYTNFNKNNVSIL